jgi:hypothetical protein
MRGENFLMLKILVLVIVFTFSACQKSEVKNNAPASQENGQNLYATIREVDFKNFTYPVETGKDTFTLKYGETPFDKGEDILFSLENIEFADLTNDSEDEAVIKILAEYGGTSTGLIYVYTLENKKPKNLWSTASGYDAKGGLKRFYSENGGLIIELFGNNQFIESKGKFEFSDEADVPKNLYRPTKFTKFRFKWNGEKLVLEDKPELFDYDLKNEINEKLPSKSNN